MVIPVLQSFAKRYPAHEITLLSRPGMGKLCGHLPDNVHFRAVNLDEYKGVRGLWRLYKELRAEKYDAVADMHDVLRTKVLRIMFWVGGTSVAHIIKGRWRRYALTCRYNKKRHSLKSSPERYAEVLGRLKYPIEIECHSIFGEELPSLPPEMLDMAGPHDVNWVGIAPFARHKGKIYPMSLLDEVIGLLSASGMYRMFLFGFGETEALACRTLQEKWPHVISLVGRFDMERELRLMAHLDVMLTMDSGNMHLAALVQTPTVSIWGATHPIAGFGGLQAPGSEQVQIPMTCRPCSVYGNKPCYKKQYPCLYGISPQVVVESVRNVCEQKDSPKNSYETSVG